MSLKIATISDYPTIMDMARRFYETTPYFGVVEYDDSKMSDVIIGLLQNPVDHIAILALDKTGEPIGMVVGQVGELLVSRDRVATEMAWWMNPEHRTSRISIEMMNAFEYWAKNVANCQYVQLSCLENEAVERVSKYYKRRNYKAFERFFIKVIK